MTTDLTYDLLKTLSADVKELNKNYERIAVEFAYHSRSQTAFRAEIDALKSEIGSVRTDVAEIKVQRRLAGSYLAGLMVAVTAVAGFVSFVFLQFIGPLTKKYFGI